MRKLVVGLVIFCCLLRAAPVVAQGSVSAADLRVLLTAQVGEHVLLATTATNAALHGNDPEFAAAAAALDANSVALADSIGLVYSAAAKDAFLPLWRSHIGFIVDYTMGVATGDTAKQDKAVADLSAYREDLGAFLMNANPNLPKDAVAEALAPHVLHLAGVVNGQASQDYTAAYSELRAAYAHAGDLGLVLADGIAQQFPEQFAGSASAPAAGLQTLLSTQLGEHTVLAAMATNAALQGRQDEFEAAAAALDNNSLDLATAVASVYGQTAGDAFLPLWRSHIGFFVDYTMGVAAGDQAKQDKAVADLDAYRQDFGAFLAGANPNLTKAAVADALAPHVMHLAGVVNAQAAQDYPTAYGELRMGYSHAGELGGILASAIAQQFPDKFTGGATAMAADTAPTDPATHSDAMIPSAMPPTGFAPTDTVGSRPYLPWIAAAGLGIVMVASYFWFHRQPKS